MKILFLLQVIPILSLKLCTNCKHFMKDKCSLFPLNDGEKHMDCATSRKFYYMCGQKGRYYEPLEIPDDYDFEIYLQLL